MTETSLPLYQTLWFEKYIAFDIFVNGNREYLFPNSPPWSKSPSSIESETDKEIVSDAIEALPIQEPLVNEEEEQTEEEYLTEDSEAEEENAPKDPLVIED